MVEALMEELVAKPLQKLKDFQTLKPSFLPSEWLV